AFWWPSLALNGGPVRATVPKSNPQHRLHTPRPPPCCRLYPEASLLHLETPGVGSAVPPIVPLVPCQTFFWPQCSLLFSSSVPRAPRGFLLSLLEGLPQLWPKSLLITPARNTTSIKKLTSCSYHHIIVHCL